ncbi:MAG: hypothetical protein ACWA5L_02960 [bacterium]
MGWWIAAAGWGFSEATFFFLVPDLILTLAVLRRGAGFAFKLAAIAAVSASLGGLILYLLGQHHISALRAIFTYIPAISPALIDQVADNVSTNWAFLMLRGAVMGQPYKLYAAEAGHVGIYLPFFLMMSVAARMARFSLAISLTWVAQLFIDRLALDMSRKKGQKIALWGLVWVLIYAFYFYKMGW